ncbi:MAG TPA: hypothetical protein VFV08_03970 [Puia sp.]|nr:hypothetical protein [Puia sp.]
MKNIYSATDLKNAIEDLEQQRIRQEWEIKDEFSGLLQSLRPANLVKQTLQDVFSSPSARNKVIGSAIGLGSGLLSRRFLVGNSGNAFRKTIGSLIQFGVAGLIAKNAEKIKTKGAELISKIFSRKKRYQPDFSFDED